MLRRLGGGLLAVAIDSGRGGCSCLPIQLLMLRLCGMLPIRATRKLDLLLRNPIPRVLPAAVWLHTDRDRAVWAAHTGEARRPRALPHLQAPEHALLLCLRQLCALHVAL